jgi:hypothetical protein
VSPYSITNSDKIGMRQRRDSKPRVIRSGGFETPWDRGGMSSGRGPLIRKKSTTEQVTKVLLAEFKRCGWFPNNLKVIEVRGEFQKPEERGAFYLNLGYIRGLDPDEVWRLLNDSKLNGKGQLIRRFPDKCGHRVLLEAIARLPQRVATPPAMMKEQM